MDKLRPLVSLPLAADTLAEIVDDAKDFAFNRGLVFKAKEGLPYEYSVTFIPFALLPSPWPKDQYDAVSRLQKDINSVYYRVSNDFKFLEKSLQRTCEVDEWTRRLWQIYERTYELQKDVLSLCILRADYMLGRDCLAKQVEVNTISSSFGGVSPVVQMQQKYVLSKLCRPELCQKLPDNGATRVALGLAQAWKMYGSKDAVICFVIEDIVYNTYDQRCIEMALIENYGMRANLIVRRKNKDFLKARIQDEKLWLGDLEVAVLYLRTWYDPSHLNTEELWLMREMVERSKAIKCPNVAWILSGCKKIQQEVARPNVLEKFCDDAGQAERVRSVFVGLYAMEEEDNYKMVISNPEMFVLKPQREGGGNNVYGKDVLPFLKSLPAHKRREYIAMDLIKPIAFNNYIVSRDKVKFTETVNELGVFGYVLADSRHIVHNEPDCGWIFRAKEAESTEGGVAAGYGVLDSPFLI